MTMLQRLLCPVDFSDPSQRALRYALAIARWYGSELTVLHVQDMLLYAASIEATGYPELAHRQYSGLRDFVNDAGGNERNVRAHITTGDEVSGILAHATSERSDLIVMGTNGRSGLARAVLGSVTERVVRRSPIPVLTIPPSVTPPQSDELMPFDPILCASDFSPACRRALDMAIVMGQEADARLILLHALHMTDVDAGIVPAPLPISAAIDGSEFRKAALRRLKRGLPSDAVFRCRPEPIVASGRPADGILEMAYREDVKLIVMGIQSRGTIGRFLFGSTTRRVMQSAGCPVLSIRAPQGSTPWPAWPPVAQERFAATAMEG